MIEGIPYCVPDPAGLVLLWQDLQDASGSMVQLLASTACNLPNDWLLFDGSTMRCGPCSKHTLRTIIISSRVEVSLIELAALS